MNVRTVDIHAHYIPPEFLEDAASNPAWRARVERPWGGRESFHDFTHIKSITVRTAADSYSGDTSQRLN